MIAPMKDRWPQFTDHQLESIWQPPDDEMLVELWQWLASEVPIEVESEKILDRIFQILQSVEQISSKEEQALWAKKLVNLEQDRLKVVSGEMTTAPDPQSIMANCEYYLSNSRLSDNPETLETWKSLVAAEVAALRYETLMPQMQSAVKKLDQALGKKQTVDIPIYNSHFKIKLRRKGGEVSQVILTTPSARQVLDITPSKEATDPEYIYSVTVTDKTTEHHHIGRAHQLTEFLEHQLYQLTHWVHKAHAEINPSAEVAAARAARLERMPTTKPLIMALIDLKESMDSQPTERRILDSSISKGGIQVEWVVQIKSAPVRVGQVSQTVEVFLAPIGEKPDWQFPLAQITVVSHLSSIIDYRISYHDGQQLRQCQKYQMIKEKEFTEVVVSVTQLLHYSQTAPL